MVACSRRETIPPRARTGSERLAFAFWNPSRRENGSRNITASSIEGLRADRPSVNPNIAIVTGCLPPGGAEAVRRGSTASGSWLLARLLRGIRRAQAGRTDLGSGFLQVKDQLPENAGRGGIGTLPNCGII